MNRDFNEKRTAVLACLVILTLLVADCSSRIAVKDAIARRSSIPIFRVETAEKKAALTYNLSTEDNFEEVVDVFARKSVTFFVDENMIGSSPKKIKRLSDGGYDIGILISAKYNDKQELYDDLASIKEETAFITGRNTDLVRFADNRYDQSDVKAVFALGLYPVQSSSDDNTPRYSKGDIIQIKDIKKADRVFKRLNADGLQSVTVGELVMNKSFEVDLNGNAQAISNKQPE